MEEMHIQHHDDPNPNPNPNLNHHHPQHQHQQQHFPIKMTQQGRHNQPHYRHNPIDNNKRMGPRYMTPKAPKREHCICITIFILLLGIILLILWLAYHPTKPRFTVSSASIYALNTTSPPLISITTQFTVFIRNPNRRVSIYFDRLSTFVTYRNQPITPRVMLPPLYLEKHGTVSMSPELGGIAPVPVSAEVLNGFVMDENYGVVGVKLIFQGRLRWKSGEIKSAHYGMYVKCDLLLGLKKGLVGQVPLLGAPVCDVNT